MLNALLLCCGLLQGIQAILNPVGSGGLFFGGGIHDHGEQNQSRPPQQPPCSASLYLAGALPRLGFEQMALEVQEADSDLAQSGGVLEPQASSTELQAAGREERSPRRCVRLLESCLGHQVPCCDPCATCYCRFFNAFCYCRKISTSFPCGKN
ncbi:PREDICTED: agouti-related protein [Aptenodytes forsteri]|uniref:agouti-related protein n=1 Tax=Aptenodytes forsteri TaxID=9233 RepID=UPI0004F43C4D|nr:PREDICTED: agouti-related protein [Aptenodytes forsteri]